MAGYSTGSGNEMTASPGYSYAYDGEGNMTGWTYTSTGATATFAYDYRNRMTGDTLRASGRAITGQETFTYDALNRRIGINSGGSQIWTVYDHQNAHADFSGSATLQQRYLFGSDVDQVLSRTSSGGSSAWYLTDDLRPGRVARRSEDVYRPRAARNWQNEQCGPDHGRRHEQRTSIGRSMRIPMLSAKGQRDGIAAARGCSSGEMPRCRTASQRSRGPDIGVSSMGAD
jgi:hypothetical protein